MNELPVVGTGQYIPADCYLALASASVRAGFERIERGSLLLPAALRAAQAAGI